MGTTLPVFRVWPANRSFAGIACNERAQEGKLYSNMICKYNFAKATRVKQLMFAINFAKFRWLRWDFVQSIAKQFKVIFCSCYCVIFGSLFKTMCLITTGVRPWDSFCARHSRAGKVLTWEEIIINNYLLTMHIIICLISLLLLMCAVLGIMEPHSRFDQNLGDKMWYYAIPFAIFNGNNNYDNCIDGI